MAEDLKKMYRTIMEDHFPDSLCIRFGDQELKYRKRSWKFPDPKTGELIEKGLRYGENPGQEAALYELIGGNLTLGDCRFIDPNSGLVSAIREEDMLQEGKHPGKTNLTDLDNGLNILKYLMGKPAAVILKHNNPCGAAYGKTLADAYYRANRADRIAAFGGCLVLNRPLEKETAELVSQNYLEVVAAPDYEEGALDLLKKRANLRIIQVRKIDRLTDFLSRRFVDFKSLIDGGLIVQQSPLNRVLEAKDLKLAETVSSGKTYKIRREPTPGEMEDLLFGVVHRTRGDIQFRALCERWMHCRNRHRRTGPCRSCRDCGIQGISKIRGCSLSRALSNVVQGTGTGYRKRESP